MTSKLHRGLLLLKVNGDCTKLSVIQLRCDICFFTGYADCTAGGNKYAWRVKQVQAYIATLPEEEILDELL